MTKKDLTLKYFQKADQLTVENKQYREAISSLFTWLTEYDGLKNDRTTKLLDLQQRIEARLVSKENGVMAGLEETAFLLKKYTPLIINILISDGKAVQNGQTVAEIMGDANTVLSYERTILNLLQRMSGIATQTDRLMKLINNETFIAATRKTPLMNLDKKAVAVGGGLTHRLNLSDGILVKDNHLALVTIENALRAFMSKYQNELIEIEVTDAKQAYKTISTFNKFNTGNHLAVMFDNFTPEKAHKTIVELKKNSNSANVIFEGSGGVNEENICAWASTGVDFISLGSLTHSVRALNISLEF